MFLLKCLGHLGPSSIYKCFICQQKNMADTNPLPFRTLEEIRKCAILFQNNWKETMPRSRQITNLSLISKSIESPPIFCIEPCDIVPGSLHCIMGQCSGLVKILQKYIERCDLTSPKEDGTWAGEFDEIFRSIGIFFCHLVSDFFWYTTLYFLGTQPPIFINFFI